MLEQSNAAVLEPTSTSLLSRARADDQEAWRQLVNLYGPLVYEWCRSFDVSPEDALDVGQEVFRAVADNLHEFRKDRPHDSFRAWLWTITRNKVSDYFRRRPRQPAAQGGSQAMRMLAQIPDRPPEASDTGDWRRWELTLYYRAMQWVRASVEPRTWNAFWEVAVIGRAPAEVALDLGMSLSAVYNANYRVRHAVRQEFVELLE